MEHTSAIYQKLTNERYIIDSVYAIDRCTYELDMGMDNGEHEQLNRVKEREHKFTHPCDRKNFSHAKIADTYTLHLI